MPIKIFQVIVYASFIYSFSGQDVVQYDSDAGLRAEELILKYGYPYQSYTVQTDDGYLLKLERVPYGKNHTRSLLKRIPVLLMPGLLCDSAVFVNMGTSSIGFLLADSGYDVWLLNTRGSTLSKRHVTFDPEIDRKEFWNFSFQEIGYYDMPKCIDHILNTTKQETIHFVGHSQGMTTYFTMLSDRPQYATKIRSVVALAPAASIKYAMSPVTTVLISFENFTNNYVKAYDEYEFLPHSDRLTKTVSTLCRSGSPLLKPCIDLVLLMLGWTPNQFNIKRIPVMITNTPAGASIKQIQHFIQFQNGNFTKFDYGVEGNIKMYGQESPPSYNISKATPPMAIYHGDTDYVTDYKDTKKLASQLPNVIKRKLFHGFNHLDVLWGFDAPKLIFKDALKFLKRYS